MAMSSPVTVIIAFTMVGGLQLEAAETITELIQISEGDEEWFTLLLSASSIAIGRDGAGL